MAMPPGRPDLLQAFAQRRRRVGQRGEGEDQVLGLRTSDPGRSTCDRRDREGMGKWTQGVP